jgi:hypothetical protein
MATTFTLSAKVQAQVEVYEGQINFGNSIAAVAKDARLLAVAREVKEAWGIELVGSDIRWMVDARGIVHFFDKGGKPYDPQSTSPAGVDSGPGEPGSPDGKSGEGSQ